MEKDSNTATVTDSIGDNHKTLTTLPPLGLTRGRALWDRLMHLAKGTVACSRGNAIALEPTWNADGWPSSCCERSSTSV